MALTEIGTISVVELIIYFVLLPVTIYLLLKHRRSALVAYIYLCIFAFLRITADGLLLSTTDESSSTYTTALTLESVALSPLLIALMAILHEIQKLVTPQHAKVLLLLQIVGHISLVAGIGLIAVGGSHLAKANETDDYRKHAQHLREGGVVILLIVWIILFLQSLLQTRHRQAKREIGTVPSIVFLFTILAATFVGIRLGYTAAYVFNPNSTSLNPITGAFAYHVIFAFLFPLLACLSLLSEGWITKYLADAPNPRSGAPAMPLVDYNRPNFLDGQNERLTVV